MTSLPCSASDEPEFDSPFGRFNPAVDRLRLSHRVKSVLKRNGILTLQDLLEARADGFLFAHGIGEKSIEEIESILASPPAAPHDAFSEELLEAGGEADEPVLRDLAQGTRAALARAGITSVSDLLEARRAGLQSIRGIGASRLCEINGALARGSDTVRESAVSLAGLSPSLHQAL